MKSGLCCTIDSATQARRWQAADRHACGHERRDVYPEHRLPMALSSEGLSAVQHVPPLLRVVALRWGSGSHSPHALRHLPREGGTGSQSHRCLIDSQSVKSAEKGGPASMRMAMMRAKRSRARSAIYW